MAKLQGLLFGLLTLLLVVLASYFFTRDWLPTLNSDRVGIDHAIAATLAVTGAVFIATNVLLAWFSFRYQDGPGATALYWHDNPRLEWTWTLATAAIMAVFLFNALGLWSRINAAPPADALQVEVMGQQFAWNVRYPGRDGLFGRTTPAKVDASLGNFIGLDSSDPAADDDVVLAQNTLYLPAGRPVRVRIRSLDVIHSFFLPHFRVKQDAMPGMTVEIWFTPQRPGEFPIACAEHCGLGHYRMRGKLYVLPAASFDQAISLPPDQVDDALSKAGEALVPK